MDSELFVEDSVDAGVLSEDELSESSFVLSSVLLSESVPDALLSESVPVSEEEASGSASSFSEEGAVSTAASSDDSWTAAAMTVASGRADVAIKTDSMTASSFFFIAFLLT
ncbi:MAG: hypothetical protein J6D46_03390 [Lachnospiraceae bacterium]|nr:hypothetical protein [Lachnospiraceae bacterium]